MSDMSFSHLLMARRRDVLFVTLNRPETRNALAPELVAELAAVLTLAETDTGVRALVLRGAGGFFCAGGSVGSFRARLQGEAGAGGEDDPVATRNRAFGHFMQRLAVLPVPVIAAVEGGAFGGGLGLACAADIVLATREARFALSETTLGIIAAQIAPFVVARLGPAATRRLGLTGERVSGETALVLGLVDQCVADAGALDEALARWLSLIGQCAPQANRAFKALVARCDREPLPALLDDASHAFARCMRAEGAEGTAAFREKRRAAWTQSFSADEVRASTTA